MQLTAYTVIHFFTKSVDCNVCGNSIVVTKQETLVISLTDFFDAALHNVVMTSYCCQGYGECLITTCVPVYSAPAHRAATCNS